VGLSFPATGAALSGLVSVTLVESGDQFQLGALGFANPSCVPGQD
jgi:hypothetical protein